MTTLNSIAKKFTAKGLAVAAAGVIGFAAMGGMAQAKPAFASTNTAPVIAAPAAETPAPIKVHGAHGRRATHIRCETRAFRRNGRRIGGTYTHVTRANRRNACRVSLRICERKLDDRRHRGNRMPFARCQVVDTDRVVVRGHRHGKNRGGASIILRF